MPMSPRLLRPRATGFHPEANSWRTRVIANGGSVSATTLAAVSKFCRDIDAAGIRDRFARLSLFCGSNLSAALVPLYLNTSPSGGTLGNATDTNNNFVSGDYAETGASGGLKGNSTTKFLDTGLTQQTVNSSGFGHLSVFARHVAYSGNNTYRMIGLISTSPSSQFYFVDTRTAAGTPTQTQVLGVHGAGTNIAQPQAAGNQTGGQLMTVTRSSASDAAVYTNATSVATDTTSRTISAINANIYVFAENRVGTGAQTHAAMTLASYSIGQSLTASQMTAYYNAMSTFQTALNRNSGI